jgi:hypothetical protein
MWRLSSESYCLLRLLERVVGHIDVQLPQLDTFSGRRVCPLALPQGGQQAATPVQANRAECNAPPIGVCKSANCLLRRLG